MPDCPLAKDYGKWDDECYTPDAWQKAREAELDELFWDLTQSKKEGGASLAEEARRGSVLSNTESLSFLQDDSEADIKELESKSSVTKIDLNAEPDSKDDTETGSGTEAVSDLETDSESDLDEDDDEDEGDSEKNKSKGTSEDDDAEKCFKVRRRKYDTSEYTPKDYTNGGFLRKSADETEAEKSELLTQLDDHGNPATLDADSLLETDAWQHYAEHEGVSKYLRRGKLSGKIHKHGSRDQDHSEHIMYIEQVSRGKHHTKYQKKTSSHKHDKKGRISRKDAIILKMRSHSSVMPSTHDRAHNHEDKSIMVHYGDSSTMAKSLVAIGSNGAVVRTTAKKPCQMLHPDRLYDKENCTCPTKNGTADVNHNATAENDTKKSKSESGYGSNGSGASLWMGLGLMSLCVCVLCGSGYVSTASAASATAGNELLPPSPF